MKNKKGAMICFLALLMLVPVLSEAKHNADVISFNPVTDGGRNITLHQTETLKKWQYNFGTMFDYAYKPLEYADNSGNRRRGIVDNLFVENFFGAVGFTNWFEAGINLPVVWLETYYNLNSGALNVPEENFYGHLGDLRLETKFLLPKIENFPVRFALVPFMYFPTGDSDHLLGNGMWSPGIKLAIDGAIKDRVWLTANIGYRNYMHTRYDNNAPDAVIDDTLELGGAVHVKVTKEWSVIGEIYSEEVISAFFENSLQNPAEIIVAGRYTPQTEKLKGLSATFGVGTGISRGLGSPDLRLFAGLQYRRPEKVEKVKKELAVLRPDRIEITDCIHFEFNKSVIKEESYSILDAVVQVMVNNPQVKLVRVEGHTDWIGSDSYNQKLSEQRAKAVHQYLIEKGVSTERLTYKGYGEFKPIADNNTTQGRALNRRTDFIVVE
ncbi:MAG: hypothetical protein COS89_05795 [Deltaproteobacteria bacterium CG07_land_8_20_14_0_80_38_7]|nr:MAG: hypothetical protein COS89_05795 [Deltaproteobacteria bacterium CG07_land_8_20_14_0_80_38_7]